MYNGFLDELSTVTPERFHACLRVYFSSRLGTISETDLSNIAIVFHRTHRQLFNLAGYLIRGEAQMAYN